LKLKDIVTLVDNENYIGKIVKIDEEFGLYTVSWKYVGNLTMYDNVINKTTDIHLKSELKKVEERVN